MNIVLQIVGGVPVTYNYIRPTTLSSTTVTASTSISWQSINAPYRTQILPGIYLNMDEHRLERN